MKTVQISRKQQGFTIIELVVVILLLGILTATALPRFMDVTDDAHEAVLDGVQGGVQTAAAMFRAQWVAEGNPASVLDNGEFGTLVSYDNSGQLTGYPAGTSTGLNSGSGASGECVTIYQNLLQTGRPQVTVSGNDPGNGSISQDDVDDAVTADSDTVFVTEHTAAHTCSYAYIGQFTTVGGSNIPVLEYNANTGEIALRATNI